MSRSTVGPYPFLELCCDETSTFGRLCEERGRPCLRVTEAVGFHRPRGVERALAFLDEHPGADVWTALPCTPWTSWTHLNEAKLGDKFKAKLAYRRRVSLQMVRPRPSACSALAPPEAMGTLNGREGLVAGGAASCST